MMCTSLRIPGRLARRFPTLRKEAFGLWTQFAYTCESSHPRNESEMETMVEQHAGKRTGSISSIGFRIARVRQGTARQDGGHVAKAQAMRSRCSIIAPTECLLDKAGKMKGMPRTSSSARFFSMVGAAYPVISRPLLPKGPPVVGAISSRRLPACFFSLILTQLIAIFSPSNIDETREHSTAHLINGHMQPALPRPLDSPEQGLWRIKPPRRIVRRCDKEDPNYHIRCPSRPTQMCVR